MVLPAGICKPYIHKMAYPENGLEMISNRERVKYLWVARRKYPWCGRTKTSEKHIPEECEYRQQRWTKTCTSKEKCAQKWLQMNKANERQRSEWIGEFSWQEEIAGIYTHSATTPYEMEFNGDSLIFALLNLYDRSSEIEREGSRLARHWMWKHTLNIRISMSANWHSYQFDERTY